MRVGFRSRLDLSGDGGNVQALPLNGMLSADDQSRVFASPSKGIVRKVIFATNVAETSVTVPGIRFVIDPGFVKQKAY